MLDFQVNADGKALRLAATSLGTSYDSTGVSTYLMQNFNQLLLFCTVAGFDATSVEIKPQVCLGDSVTVPGDSSSWFDIASGDAPAAGVTPVRSGVYQMLGNGTLVIPVPSCYKWVRVVAKRTGGTVATTLAITAQQGKA